MTVQLERAFAVASRLPDHEQAAFADWMLAELRSEERWSKLFAESQDVLEMLADEALAEFEAGETEELDPEAI